MQRFAVLIEVKSANVNVLRLIAYHLYIHSQTGNKLAASSTNLRVFIFGEPHVLSTDVTRLTRL